MPRSASHAPIMATSVPGSKRAFMPNVALVPAVAIHGARRQLPALDLLETLEESLDGAFDGRRPRAVWGDHDLAVVPERRVRGQRFDGEDVERGSRKPAFVKRLGTD